MSTTHIQPLPNVYGRMAYTELGEGKKRTENIQNGTNRIAAQMGDGDSREEFVRFCSAMKRQNHKIDSDKTAEREFGNLLKIQDNYPKIVVTEDTFSGNSYEGIRHCPIRQFLME